MRTKTVLNVEADQSVKYMEFLKYQMILKLIE